MILFASAGTGKTFTVASRVANVLAQNRATAEEILCLTFTIKACNEMKEDIAAYVGERAKEIQVNTIHGFCYQLLMEETKRSGLGYQELGVCDEVDQEEILRSILSSRFYYWKIERALEELGAACPDLDEREIFRLQDHDGLFWRVEDFFVGGNGEVLDAAKERTIPLEAHCQVCDCTRRIENRRCTHCGEEIAFRLPHKQFEIYNRKAALRNLVSEVKHCRDERGTYSEREEVDYQQAFSYLREHKKETYEGLISYYARYLGYAPDQDFEEAMQAYIGRLIEEYNEHLRLSNLLDFDDLILQAKAVVNGEGEEYWSRKYKYVVLDEMQDTSALEYSVLKKIFAKNNAMLCGDYFQTIYGWRGSRPTELLQAYIEEFSAQSYMLSENYRATKTLAAATFGYLQNTFGELLQKYCPQTLITHSEEEGEKIFCYAFDNPEQEAWQIYKYLLRNPPKTASDACIIARSNKYIAELSKYFQRFYLESEEKDPLRFFTVEENLQFFKRPVIKDILACIKLILNPLDRVSMERLTEKFVRQVGIKTIERLRGYNRLGVSILSFADRNTYECEDPYTPLIEGVKRGEVVVYDTETTGLDLSKDQIVQLSAVKINEAGEIVDCLDVWIEPTVPIAEAALDTHGFTLEYIRAQGGLKARDALEAFSAFVKGAVLVGHNNLAYDKPLVQRQLKENALPCLEIRAEYDTLTIAKQFYPELENYKLSTLCERFSVVNECAHNALGDITATAKCLVQMVRETVLPTALERVQVLGKYKDKFEKFYVFLEELRSRLENDEELPSFIIDKLFLKKRYPTSADYTAMRDIVEGLNEEQGDRKAFLREYCKDAALASSQMDILLKKWNRIPIITVHQAKGCEFDTVFLAGADDSNFPSFAAKQSGAEEEEKKVFYVALTRAKRKLILTRALHGGKYDRAETPYFWKIPEEYVRMNEAWKNGN